METTKRAQSIIDNIESTLREKLYELGPVKASRISGFAYQDLSAWLHGRRKWSVEKMLTVADKLILDED